MSWLYVSCGLMVITAVVHSALSETRLVPALSQAGRAGTIIRYALHVMSIYMLLSAATVAWQGTPTHLIELIGAGWILVGLSGLIVLGGKNFGWPVIVGAGVAAILGVVP